MSTQEILVDGVTLYETGNRMRPVSLARHCEKCGVPFVPKSHNARFCCDCRKVHEREKAYENWVKRGKPQYKFTGTGKGYNQSGLNNGNYRNGTGVDWYHEAIKVLPECCNRCGAVDDGMHGFMRYLVLHHKDGNHENNDPSNWEILCKRCHQLHHSKRGADGRFVSNKG